jgi:hypothetical protein
MVLFYMQIFGDLHHVSKIVRRMGGRYRTYREGVKQPLLGRTVNTTAALAVVPGERRVSNVHFHACTGHLKLPYRNHMSGL